MLPQTFPDRVSNGTSERPSVGGAHMQSVPCPDMLKVKKRKRSLLYVCHNESCSEKFSTNKELDTHMKLHFEVKPFACNMCGKVCMTERRLEIHQHSHANDSTKPVCDICNRTFSSQSSLNKHKKVIHKPKPHLCPACHSGFEECRYMVIHAKQTHGLDLPLEISEMSNSDKTDSVNKTSDDTLKESCLIRNTSDNSPAVNTSPSEAHNHLQEKHCNSLGESILFNKRELKITCELCSSTFPSVAYLEQHRAVHINENIVCHVCSLNFANHNDFTTHVKIHYTENEGDFNPFKDAVVKCTKASDRNVCLVCKEHFANLGSLKRHMAQGHYTSEIKNVL